MYAMMALMLIALLTAAKYAIINVKRVILPAITVHLVEGSMA